jgi:hypothetical protein
LTWGPFAVAGRGRGSADTISTALRFWGKPNDVSHVPDSPDWRAVPGGQGHWLGSIAFSSNDVSQWPTLFPVALAGVVVWSLWLYRFVPSRLAEPIVDDFATTTSVVVPSYHEDPDILVRCLPSWRAQRPDEIIVVLDVADTEYDYMPAMGPAGTGLGFALRPVLSNVVACENHVSRAAEGVSDITCR